MLAIFFSVIAPLGRGLHWGFAILLFCPLWRICHLYLAGRILEYGPGWKRRAFVILGIVGVLNLGLPGLASLQDGDWSWVGLQVMGFTFSSIFLFLVISEWHRFGKSANNVEREGLVPASTRFQGLYEGCRYSVFMTAIFVFIWEIASDLPGIVPVVFLLPSLWRMTMKLTPVVDVDYYHAWGTKLSFSLGATAFVAATLWWGQTWLGVELKAIEVQLLSFCAAFAAFALISELDFRRSVL